MARITASCVFGWIMSFSGIPSSSWHEGRIQWKTLQQAGIANEDQKKPILIDLYTNWCGWCKVMDKKTYSNKNVVKYLEEKFYAVKLNAETREDITWSGKMFRYNPSYKLNEIALYLTQSNLAFPTTVIIPSDGAPPQAIPGYLTPKQIEVILKYFGENNYGKISFPEYQKAFMPAW